MNYIYWKGRIVGIDHGHFVSWFSTAAKEAIEGLREIPTGGEPGTPDRE